MIKEEIDKLTVEGLFEVRRITAEETMRLYEECKNTSKFFIEKVEYHSMFVKTDALLIDSLIYFLVGEIRRFKTEVELLVKTIKDGCILPIVKMPNFYEIESDWDYICNMEMSTTASGNKQLVALKKLVKEVKTSLFSLGTMSLMYSPSNVEEKFKVISEQYEREHYKRLKIYIEDFESAEAVKASLREEYKDDIAVKCWKNAAHNVKRTISAMHEQGCIERDLLPLFEYIAKCKMLELFFGLKKVESDINEANALLMKRDSLRNTTVNIYDCPAVNINQAQDVISEGGIKNVHNHKKQ